jgi:hypothetical protein|uniref:Uncharacterized protein n=1 Tax=candidate division WOR-3 bacterium TaxID=2052148 RepID=A0A7V3PSA2_UNCW3
MFAKGLERVMQFTMVCVLVVAGVVVMRLKSIEPGILAARTDFHQAMNDYQIKKIATERMLNDDNIYR